MAGRTFAAASPGQAPGELARRTACAVLSSPVPRSRTGCGRRRLNESTRTPSLVGVRPALKPRIPSSKRPAQKDFRYNRLASCFAHVQPVGPSLLALSCSLALSARHLVRALGTDHEAPTFSQCVPAFSQSHALLAPTTRRPRSASGSRPSRFCCSLALSARHPMLDKCMAN